MSEASNKYYHKNKDNPEFRALRNKRSREWNHANKERVAETSKKRYAEHKDEVKALNKKYYWKDPEKSRARAREWQEANPARVKENMRRWRESNAEHVKVKFKEWKEKNPWSKRRATSLKFRVTALCGQAKTRAKKKGWEYSLDKKRILRIFQIGVCEVTGLPFVFSAGPRSPWAPSLDRVDTTKGYTDDNVKVVVWAYNAAKGTWPHEDVLRLAAALAHKPTPAYGCTGTI